MYIMQRCLGKITVGLKNILFKYISATFFSTGHSLGYIENFIYELHNTITLE